MLTWAQSRQANSGAPAGLWLPNKPSKLLSQGFELATNYDELPDEKEYARLYEGKRVAVFGLVALYQLEAQLIALSRSSLAIAPKDLQLARRIRGDRP